MPNCKAAVKVTDRVVRCQKLSNACGFICSVPLAVCAACEKVGGAAADIKDTPLAPRVKSYLEGRLIAGDCPRYQAPNPIDLNATFAKFAAIAPKEKQEALIAEMLSYQAAIPMAEGGHDAATLAAKLAAIAAAHGVEAALEEAAHVPAK